MQNSQLPQGVFVTEKLPGETLAVLLERFRAEHGFAATVPVTYAGRLDPMASGLMFLLVGETCKEKDRYLGRDKTYLFEVLFGVSTDTFDMLGLVTHAVPCAPEKEEIQRVVENVQKKTVFSYPPYSSKPVEGKPLFMHAKAGTLPSDMPTMSGEIKELVLKEVKTVSAGTLIRDAVTVIDRVEGDFRQKEILNQWEEFSQQSAGAEYAVATIEGTVTSGVYIRTIATLVGEALGVPALAYSIHRTRIGEYTAENK